MLTMHYDAIHQNYSAFSGTIPKTKTKTTHCYNTDSLVNAESWWIHRKLLTVSSIDLSKLFSIMCMLVFVYVWANPLCSPLYVNTCVMCEPTCARSHLSSQSYCAEQRLAGRHFRGFSSGVAELWQPQAWLKSNCHHVSSQTGVEWSAATEGPA